MADQVLVGWDGSSRAAEAARWAARLPGRPTIELVRVYDDVDIATDWEATGGTEAGARVALEREANVLAKTFPGVAVATTLARGRRAEVLQALTGPDVLLVLGTERRSGARFRFRFSLAARLAGSAAGPVAVVPEGGAEAHGPVVVGVDGSPNSRAAAAVAAEEADRRSVDLVVLHAWSEVLDWDLLLPFDSRPLPEYETAHRRLLDGVVETVTTARPGLTVRPLLIHGRPVQALLGAAEGASLLVLGQHGRDPDPAAPPGSVTHGALLGIRVPTLVTGSVTSTPRPAAAVVDARPTEG